MSWGMRYTKGTMRIENFNGKYVLKHSEVLRPYTCICLLNHLFSLTNVDHPFNININNRHVTLSKGTNCVVVGGPHSLNIHACKGFENLS